MVSITAAYLICSCCGRTLPIDKDLSDEAGWRLMELAGWTVLSLGRYACRHCSQGSNQ